MRAEGLTVDTKTDSGAAPGEAAVSKPDQAACMDRMYRYTRHVYDLSRRYYLLGRDRLIRRMAIEPGDQVLEVGCGTARNLIKLAERYPEQRFYGLDASRVMLATAQRSLQSSGVADRVVLKPSLAEQLDFHATFNLDRPFDVIFFSYSLSMIPTWQQAIDAAITNLKPAGRMYVVDFWDQSRWPRLFRIVLRKWLAMFHVHSRPELLDYIELLAAEGKGELTMESISGRYAYLASFVRK